MSVLGDKLLDLVLRRRQAYRHVFNKEDRAVADVLADLSKFCRATTTPAVVSPVTQTMDPMATGILIGRLEVWHRISQNIHLSDADLYKMVEQQRNQQGGDE